MKQLTIEQVLPLIYHEEFCKQHKCEDVDLIHVGDEPRIIGIVEEVTECYYGHMLIPDVIVGEWSMDYIQDWITDFVMSKVGDFCDEMNISLYDLSQMLEWHAVCMNFLVPEWEWEEESLEEGIFYDDIENQRAYDEWASEAGWLPF